MSKILSAKKAEQVIVQRKLAKFPVKRAQSSNNLALLKSIRVAPKLCHSSTQQQIHQQQRAVNKKQGSSLAKEQLNIIYMKMLHQRKFGLVDAKTAPFLTAEEEATPKKKQTINTLENADIKKHKNVNKSASAAKKWTSALRVVSAMTRFKNVPKKNNELDTGSRGSSFSNESTPSRTYATEQQDVQQNAVIDPVYLALKEATTKYGGPPSVGGGSSGGESRRDSENFVNTATAFDASATATTMRHNGHNLSQTSLYDSGNHSETELLLQMLLNARSGSTPQLHGVSFPPYPSATRRDSLLGLLAPLNGTFSHAEVSNRLELTKKARPPKLSSQMKSISFDCAEMIPSSPPMQSKNGGIRYNHYMHKMPIRSARAAFVSSGGFAPSPIVPGEFEGREKRTESPCAVGNPSSAGAALAGLRRQRRLPPVPVQQQQQTQAVTVPTTVGQTPTDHLAKLQNRLQLLHIVTHEYASGECSLRPGDRLMVVDNGDPDWKHGFKLNDRLEQLITFPSSCVASYKAEEQPMRLLQSCNLSDQKLRLYRDQVVFAQPDSLSKDGKVMVRNEHDKFAKCPLQFLSLA